MQVYLTLGLIVVAIASCQKEERQLFREMTQNLYLEFNKQIPLGLISVFAILQLLVVWPAIALWYIAK